MRLNLADEIYVVMGTTGEYSDRDEWPVAWCATEQAAQRLVHLATLRAEAIYAEREDRYSRVSEGYNEFDPNMRMDYTGTSYYYLTVREHRAD